MAAAGGSPRDLVAVGSVVSLKREDDGTGKLVALVRISGPGGGSTPAPTKPVQTVFLCTKDTRFLKGIGPDGEVIAVDADQLSETFTKGTTVTIRCYPASSKLVATEVRAGGSS